MTAAAIPAVLFLLLAAFFTFSAGHHFGREAVRNRLGINVRPRRWTECDQGMLSLLCAVCAWALSAYALAKGWGV